MYGQTVNLRDLALVSFTIPVDMWLLWQPVTRATLFAYREYVRVPLYFIFQSVYLHFIDNASFGYNIALHFRC